MSILLTKDSKVVISGITGREGSFHARQMIEYGTNVVAGVTPGKGGQVFEAGDVNVPVFNSVREAVEATGADASMIIVPARFAVDAIYETVDAGVPFIVCLSEYIPVLDMIAARNFIDSKDGVRLLGPNCPGLLTPGEAKLGFIPGSIAMPGPVGVVSKSGTLTYEVIDALTRLGIGQTTCIGIGGDPINGTDFIDVLEMFENDPDTEHIVMIGEIGGNAEEQAAAYIKEHVSKPVTSFIAGRTAPPGRRMGHAGAIVEGSSGSAEGKIEALRAAGVPVADNPDDIAKIVAERMGSK